MTNNIFNIKAAEAGRTFARANPNATGVQIDDAAPTLEPARRHFQMAALDMLNRSLTQIFYRWGVSCRSGHCEGGMAHDIEDAYKYIKNVSQLYHHQGHVVTRWSIYNQDKQLVASMDLC